MSIYTGGRHMPISILGLDLCGEDVHETGLIWDQGDGDLRAWPIPGTLVPLHGTNPPRAEVFMSLYTLDGKPMTSDPRHALQRQVDAMAAEGLHPAGAFELEFFLSPMTAIRMATVSYSTLAGDKRQGQTSHAASCASELARKQESPSNGSLAEAAVKQSLKFAKTAEWTNINRAVWPPPSCRRRSPPRSNQSVTAIRPRPLETPVSLML